MAHGEMVMIGAYVTFCVQQVFRAYAPDFFGTSVIVAIPAAFIVAGLIGILIERCMIRFLYGRPLETLLATWGPQPHPPAGDPLPVRRRESGCRLAGLDERLFHGRRLSPSP